MILDFWWNIGGTCCGVGETGVILVELGGILVELGGILVIFGEILVELWVYGGACWCIETIGWIGHWLDMVYLPPQGEFCRPYFS